MGLPPLAGLGLEEPGKTRTGSGCRVSQAEGSSLPEVPVGFSAVAAFLLGHVTPEVPPPPPRFRAAWAWGGAAVVWEGCDVLPALVAEVDQMVQRFSHKTASNYSVFLVDPASRALYVGAKDAIFALPLDGISHGSRMVSLTLAAEMAQSEPSHISLIWGKLKTNKEICL